MESKNMNLIIIYYLLIFIKSVLSDCGLPAIPFNAQIDKIQQIFYEGESVQYHCQLVDLKLIGSDSRKCVNSRWVGTIPKCVEELRFGTISAINLADDHNHTFTIRNNWMIRDPSAAYYADSKRDNCLKSSKMSRPHYWKLHLTKLERHISYIEIVVLDKYKHLIETDISKIIKYAKVNEFRECVPEMIGSSDFSIRISLNCLTEFDGDSKYEAWERDVTQMITFEFDIDDITICEIRLFANSFMPFHRCGSADIVLHSTMEFIKEGNKYGRDPYYKYKCDEGFDLEGNEDVRCGFNNQWLDSFPTCRPQITCPFPPSNHESISVDIKLEHIFNFGDNISAIIGSLITHNCIDYHNKSIMIGDSVRVCGEDGKWSGSDPICIHNYELNDEFYEEILKNMKTNSDVTSFKSFNSIISNANKISLACGIPAMPLFAKPTSSQRFRLFGAQSDLRLWYENGSTIYYQCESAYRWVTGDVDSRICVNGKWIGRVGKCAINWGNKIRLNSIRVYDYDNHKKWINQHNVMDINDTTHWDEHFAYRRDPDKGECATFTVEARHKWVLHLNESTTISYFAIMLHPGGFFGNKRKINDEKILEKTPITAEIGKNQCVLTSAWDYTYSRVGTFFFFTCDMDEPKYRYTSYEMDLNIYIDPKKFPETYKATNISFCSLAVMVSKEDCGTPDVPLHSTVTYNSNTHEWTYSCVEGYALIGSPTVSCGRNGRWIGEFPTCEKRELCQISNSFSKELLIKYNNLAKIDGKDVAVIDSLANYSCVEQHPEDNKIMIGPSLRSCVKTGQWSGTEPLCIDPSKLPKISKTEDNLSSLSTATIFAIVILSLLTMSAIFGAVYYAYMNGSIKMPDLKNTNLTIPNIKIQSESRVSTTPNLYESTDEVLEQQSNVRSCNINEDLPAFPTGTECLVEPDSEA